MNNLKEKLNSIFTTNAKDKTSKIHLPVDSQYIKLIDNKYFYYADFEEYGIGPIPIANYKIEEDTIVFDRLINNPVQIRAKGKLRKKVQSTSTEEEYMMVGNEIIVGPVYTLTIGRGTYKGQIEKNIPHGIGVYISETEIYHGPYVNGKRTGWGIVKYINKMLHVETKIVIYQEKEYYIGEFLNNKRHGTGTLICTLKNSPFKKCTGTWIEDRLEGPECAIEYIDRDTYEGPVVNNLHDGYGISSYPDGSVDKGWWVKGCRHGTSICIKPDTTVIRQNWIFGMPGRHCITFPDKERFYGHMFKFGASHPPEKSADAPAESFAGCGTLFFPSKVKFSGIIHSRIPLNGWGSMYFPSGSEYFGEIVNEKRHGWGIFIYRSKDSYTDGDKYIGMWANDKRNGWGTYYCKLRSYSVHTYWVDDQCYNKSMAWNKYYAESDNYFDHAKSDSHLSEEYIGMWQPRLKKCYEGYSTLRPILDHAYWIDPKYKKFHGFYYHD